ncbi:MAG: synthase chain [Actinomycetia bacterium]|nr:synthase chain [Actinomycetes bacterium]
MSTPKVTPPDVDGIESRIARDIARHAAMIAPFVVLVTGLVWGWAGALGAALAFGLVVVNFMAGAAILGWAARISPETVTVAAMGGYLVSLLIFVAAGVAIKQVAAVDFKVFCFTLIGAHLGLLFWELRSISLSLASPGLRPAKNKE